MIKVLKKFFVNLFTHKLADIRTILFPSGCVECQEDESLAEDYIILEDGQKIRRHGIAMWSLRADEDIDRTCLRRMIDPDMDSDNKTMLPRGL